MCLFGQNVLFCCIITGDIVVHYNIYFAGLWIVLPV